MNARRRTKQAITAIIASVQRLPNQPKPSKAVYPCNELVVFADAINSKIEYYQRKKSIYREWLQTQTVSAFYLQQRGRANMTKSRIKDGNFITIQSFMVKELKLKGNELLTFAVIYGFSQNGEDRFTGSLQYICDWTNSTKQGIMKTLKSLVEKGLIEKTEVYKNGVKFVEYHTTEFTTIKQSFTESETKFNEGGKQSLTGGMQQSLPNNISTNNIVDIKEDKKERKKEPNGYDAIISQSPFTDEVKETIIEFVKMRKLIKKPMTDYALKILLNKLGRFASDPQTQIAILEKSINNCWQDIYEPKEEKQEIKQEEEKPVKRTIYDIV